jgi:hypothetical protein
MLAERAGDAVTELAVRGARLHFPEVARRLCKARKHAVSCATHTYVLRRAVVSKHAPAKAVRARRWTPHQPATDAATPPTPSSCPLSRRRRSPQATVGDLTGAVPLTHGATADAAWRGSKKTHASTARTAGEAPAAASPSRRTWLRRTRSPTPRAGTRSCTR